jgi:integrase/recombinase XerD
MGGRFTRPGVTYLIKKYCDKAFEPCTLAFPVTPHVFRHSKSMHMIRAGVNVYYIKEFLGHADLSTTENFYVRTDAEMKRNALEKVRQNITPSITESSPYWKKDTNLLDWLKSLG